MNTDDTFADVTLVCDDGRQIRAHKVVLGASSPILKNMLITEDTSIIYCLVIHYNHFHTENQKLTTKSERDDLGPSVWPSSSRDDLGPSVWPSS